MGFFAMGFLTAGFADFVAAGTGTGTGLAILFSSA